LNRRAAVPLMTLALATPGVSRAHAVGERYELPLPLGHFVIGAALTVGLSFVVVALLARNHGRTAGSRVAMLPMPGSARGPGVLRLLGVASLLLVLVTGAFGDGHPARNIAPTVVWILGWVGLSLVAACIVNPWPALDPWRTLHDLSIAASRRIASAHAARTPRPYPARLAAWPAVLLLLACSWIEVVLPVSSTPAVLAALLATWTVINLAAMARYGAEAWQTNGDFLARAFATFGRFAPLMPAPGGGLALRWPGAGLAGQTVDGLSGVAFIVMLLATVLFDGLTGTQFWRIYDRFISSVFAGAFAPWLDRDGIVLGTIGIVGTWFVLFAAFLLSCRLAAMWLPGVGTRGLAERLAMSLVPIAVGYHVAHNFSYVVEQGRAIIALVSDPFGIGWNLFGTAGYQADIGLISARSSWHIALTAVVAGHVLSIWLGHRETLAHAPNRRAAIAASVPLTVLMVGYTALSLLILADPLTRYSKPDSSYSAAPHQSMAL